MSTILTLLAVALNEQPLTRPITARFDSNGGTIGRADHSTLALPDPERFISRKQAEIVFTSAGYIIRNVGAANPILVGRRTLGQGETAVLQHGDDIRIGGYELRAQCEPPSPAAALPDETLPPGTAVQGVAPAAAASPAERVAAAADPVAADILASAAPLPAAPDETSVPMPVFQPPADVGSAANPFADLLGAASPAASNPFADLLAPVSAPPASSAPTDWAAPSSAAIGHAESAAAWAPRSTPTAPNQAFVQAPVQAPVQEPVQAHAVAPRAVPSAFDGLIPAPSGIAATSAAFAAPAPAAARLPDDFDPFRLSKPHAAARATDAASPADDPFADLRPADNLPSVDLAFDLPAAATGEDPLARFMSGATDPAQKPAAAVGGAATDPLAALGFTAGEGPAVAAGPAQPDHLPAMHGAFAPPRVAPSAMPPQAAHIPTIVALAASPAAGMRAGPAAAPAPHAQDPVPAPAGAAAAAAPARNAAGIEALWQAFCDGAGVALPPPAGASAEERMRLIGRVLRNAVDGTLQLMAVRASTKSEMRAAVTQIQARSNNPLKFAPDGAAGIEQLVQPAARGFLEGPAAMQDAMFDLVGHSIGSVQGMRAALEGMLDRFDPAELEAKLGAGRLLDSLLPMNRKARLWELYLQHYRAIREEAQEDFHTLFGRAFVAAYEQQVERLKTRSGS